MSNFFRNLGRKTGAKIHKAKWYYDSLAGEENDSINAEFEMGAFLARDHRSQMQVLQNERVRTTCAALANRLANENWCITPTVLDNQCSEAFALPGGFIFITNTLVNFCDDDDRLAFVLAHEIGHVIKRHAIRRVAASQAAGFFNQALASRTPATRMLTPFVGQLVQNGYTEEQEFDADDFACRLTKSAGYHPAAGIQWMRELLDVTDELPIISTHFAAHPPLKQRIARMQKAQTSTPE